MSPEDRRKLLSKYINAKFIRKSHAKLPTQQPAEVQIQQRTAFADAALSRTEFEKIQQLSGSDFTFDACCKDGGSNKLCNDFASPADSFTSQSVSGKHVWINPPASQAESFLDHMLKEWHKDPKHTSACILLPATMSYLASSDSHKLRLIHKYANGSRIFQSFTDDGSHGKMYACNSAMHVNMLDPGQVQM
jgi:hypothetical protein